MSFRDFLYQLCSSKKLLFRVKKSDVDLFMLTIRNNIFCICENLLIVWYITTSSIVIDIKKEVQTEWFFLLKNVCIQLLIFCWKFSIDLWCTIADRIFSHVDFFASRSFHNMLKNTKSLADNRSREFDAKFFFHERQLND